MIREQITQALVRGRRFMTAESVAIAAGLPIPRTQTALDAMERDGEVVQAYGEYATPNVARWRKHLCRAVLDRAERTDRTIGCAPRRVFRDNEIKLRAINLYKGGLSVAQVARELGLPDTTVRDWCTRRRKSSFVLGTLA